MPTTSNAGTTRSPLPEARQHPITKIDKATRAPVVERIMRSARVDVARFSSAP